MRPTYHFPNDKAESFAAFRVTPALWLSVAEYTRVAVDSYRLAVSRETTERWLRTLVYLYVFDRMLDGAHDPGRRLTAKKAIEASLLGELPPLPEWTGPHVRHAHDLVWSSMQELGDQAQAAIERAGRQGLLAAQRKAVATTVREHVKAVRLENYALADLNVELLTLQEHQQSAVQKVRTWAFRSYLRRLYTHFGVQDTLEDMESDWQDMLVKVEPTKPNRRSLENAYRRSILHLYLRPIVTTRVIRRAGDLSRSKTAERWNKWLQQVTITD